MFLRPDQPHTPAAGRSQSGRLVLVAPLRSYRVAPFLQAARELGVEVYLVTRGEQSVVAEGIHGVHVDLDQPAEAFQRILFALGDTPVGAVLASDDAGIELAAKLSAHYGLPHNPTESALLSRRKDLARARLLEAGLPVPQHRRIHLDRPLAAQLDEIVYPAVAKPLSLSGSRGVIRADDHDGLLSAIERIRPLIVDLAEPVEARQVLVESYIPGVEVALEGMLDNGRLQVLALFDKPDPLEGPYFEETYYILPSRHPRAMQERIAERVQQACAAYGLCMGPVHAELRWFEGDAWILEVASRTIGGQCGRLLRFGTGTSLENLVLSQALRLPVPAEASPDAAGVLMIPIPRAGILRRVEGMMAALRVPYIEDIEISVREGYALVPLPEGNSYLGFIFARAPTSAEAEAALRRAHACLRIVTVPLLGAGSMATTCAG
ncbi:MAG: ATP-grasp domain-containing protein [Chromatiales bacterium]|nr:ATP-grasp domain-containing protein [Chromatiales bacterium]